MNQSQKARYGLIGYPVEHSLSAAMHNAAFTHDRIDAEYRLIEVPPDDLKDFFARRVRELGLAGFNVTIPHKERVLEYLSDGLDQGARVIGAVNTVVVNKTGLRGFNTDQPGFVRALQEQGGVVEGRQVALLGAGGGAKAVAAGLAGQKPRCLRVYDMDLSRSAALAALARKVYPAIEVVSVNRLEDLDIRHADLLVNATPVGMKPQDPLLIDEGDLHPGLFVYDLIYNPAKTRLLEAAAKAGCRCANGLGMLLWQGCLAFERWTNRQAPVQVMRKALEESIHG